MSSHLSPLTAQNTMAIDPHGLEALRRLNGQDATAAAKAVAQQFESLLMQQMLGAMRKASQALGEESGGAGGLFRSMQDQQWAQLPAFRNGLGLTDAILRQINQQRSTVSTATNQAQPSPSPATVSAAPAKPATVAASAAEGFVDKLTQVAGGAASALGLEPHLLLAQAALESGWGKRAIKTAEGKDSHNLFGIKAGSNWNGKTADVVTTEYVDGKAQKRVEKFRAYDSDAEAFTDYVGLMRHRFAAATGLGNDAAGFGRALQSSGYATDPAYASKIERVAQRIAAHQNGSSRRA